MAKETQCSLAPFIALLKLPKYLIIFQPAELNHIVVIHPGSKYLRIGFSSDTSPNTVLHCLARRQRTAFRRQPLPDAHVRTELGPTEVLWWHFVQWNHGFLLQVDRIPDQELRAAECALGYRCMSTGAKRKPTLRTEVFKSKTII